jgi:hypothetical protein
LGWGEIVSLVLTVVGLPLTFWVGRRTRQRPDFNYATDSQVLLKPTDDLMKHKLSVSHDGRPVSSLSRTRVALWNRRGDTIEGSSVLSSDPVRVSVAEGETIFRASVLSSSRPQNGISIEIGEHGSATAVIRFDFLDSGDGAVVEVLHSGAPEVTITGTVKGTDLAEQLGLQWPEEAAPPRDPSVSFGQRIKRRLSLIAMSPRTGRPSAVRLAGSLVAVIGAVLFIVPLGQAIASMSSATKTIDASQYDLTTVAGQERFSLDFAMRNQGGGDPSDLEIHGLMGAFLAVGIAAFAGGSAVVGLEGRRIRRVPKRILRTDP